MRNEEMKKSMFCIYRKNGAKDRMGAQRQSGSWDATRPKRVKGKIKLVIGVALDGKVLVTMPQIILSSSK